MANTFFDKWVDNRNTITEKKASKEDIHTAGQAVADQIASEKAADERKEARAERLVKVKEKQAELKVSQFRNQVEQQKKKDEAKKNAEARKKDQAVQLKKDKRVKQTQKAFKAAGKFKKEKTGYGDDSLKAGGVVASNLVRTVGAVGKKVFRGAQYAAAKRKKPNGPPPPSGGGDPKQKRLPSAGQTGKKPPMSSAIVHQKKERLGVQARRDPELRRKMTKERGGTVTEGLRTAVKNVIKKVKAYQKKRKSIVKRDPDATAMATTKGSKMVKYEKQPSSVSKAGSSAVTSTAKKKVEPKKGKETEGQKARRDPDYRKKKIEQDVAAARKWVNRRKAVKAVQSVAQKAKDTASSAKEAGGKLVKSVSSGKLARQIRTGAYKAKKAATETGKKVAKATLEKDPTAKLGARFRNWHHKQNTRSDRYLHYKRKGIKPLSGKGKPKSEDKPKSDGKVPDPWNEEYAIDEGISTNIESWKKRKKKKRKSKKVKFPKATNKDNSLTAVGKSVAYTANKIASNWREEFLHEVEQPEMGETDQKEPNSKSKSKKSDDEKKVDVMKGKNKVEVNPKLKAESLDHTIDSDKHKKAQKIAKIRNLAKDNKNPNEKEVAKKKAGGPNLFGEDSVMIQDADGNDFLEVIDVIKAEPLVPVKEGRINGNGKQEKFNRAMNAYRKAQRAGNLSNKERVDRLKDNAKIRRDAEKKEKKGKQFAGGQVYNEDKKSKMVSIVKAVANEKKRKNALQIQKYIGEEDINEISMRTARIAFDKAGKKADEAQKKGDKQTADIKSTQRANIGYMIRARERKLDKRKGDLERTLKNS